MTYFEVLLATLLPIVVALLPGISIARSGERLVLQYLARVVMWSVSLVMVFSFLAALAQVSQVLPIVLVVGVTVFAWRWRRFEVPPRRLLAVMLAGILLYAIFGGLFLYNHDGLPTGDSQKAIYWGEYVNDQHRLPDYRLATPLLNRDPVDFYTPGLHTLTAFLMRLSPAPLTTVGLFAVVISLSVALLAAATLQLLAPRAHATVLAAAAFFVLTNFRFLRYLREPGYHFQNVLGELLLFGMVFILLSLLRRWRWLDALLVVVMFISLLIGHQFSAFLAVFVVLPLGAALVVNYFQHPQLRAYLTGWRLAILSLLIVIAVGAGFSMGLHQKIPHIFTFNSHLRHLVLPLIEYPHMLGELWVLGGLAGLLVMLRYTRPWRDHLVRLAFIGVALVLLVLSQGPVLGIDIPPVRALFYSVWTLAIALAFFVGLLGERLGKFSYGWRQASWLLLTVVVLGASAGSFASILPAGHALRTNSTLLAEQLSLVEWLEGEVVGGRVVVDDYNRRSSSWLLLGNHGMFTRIAADIRTQMAEALQSPLRRELYLRQLDFEKIFSLGSRAEVGQLLTKTNTTWVTGVAGSSNDAFSHNPLLKPVAYAGDMTLYEHHGTDTGIAADNVTTQWLSNASTLVNDIGDSEDTYEHLPASLRATRLSVPQHRDGRTLRGSRAPIIPLRFNVRDYVKILLNHQQAAAPETALEFYVELINPVPELAVQSRTGFYQVIRGSSAKIRLEPGSVAFDEDGFITLYLINPQQLLVEIDLIALGLAQVP